MAITIPDYVYAGAAGPDVLTINYTPSNSLPDLTVVSAVSMVLADTPVGPLTWAASITGQTASLLTVSRVFANDGSDVPIAGSYWVSLRATTPAGVRRFKPVLLLVKKLL